MRCRIPSALAVIDWADILKLCSYIVYNVQVCPQTGNVIFQLDKPVEDNVHVAALFLELGVTTELARRRLMRVLRRQSNSRCILS